MGKKGNGNWKFIVLCVALFLWFGAVHLLILLYPAMQTGTADSATVEAYWFWRLTMQQAAIVLFMKIIRTLFSKVSQVMISDLFMGVMVGSVIERLIGLFIEWKTDGEISYESVTYKDILGLSLAALLYIAKHNETLRKWLPKTRI